MTCDHMESRLHDYLDGLLSGNGRAAVEAHLERCPACRDALARWQELRADTASLPREILPPRDLWPNIATRIEAAPIRPVPRFWQQTWRWTLPVAAAAAVVLAVLYGIGQFRDAGVMPRPGSQAAFEQDAAEAAYEAARTELLQALDAREEALAPDTLKTVEENLQVIDDAVREIRTALDDDPANPRLLRMLMATRRKELGFLGQMVRLPEGS